MTVAEPPLSAYGRWPSPLSAASLFDGTETISCLRPGREGLFFLLSLPEEGNALVLMHLSAHGNRVRVSPAGMNLRSQVHEYGGLPYTFSDDTVFYSNFSDQRVYRQPFDQERQASGLPQAMTPRDAANPKALRYADLLVDESRQRLIGVREDHRDGTAEPRNTLVALPFGVESEGEILFAASDFVASPCLSRDGERLAFQAWSHPNMPWDHTQIHVGSFDSQGKLQGLRTVCAERPGALVQPAFSPRGELYFIADWNDWWNLYRIDAALLASAGGPMDAEPVMPMGAELCSPQWQLGQHSYDFVDADTILLSLNRACAWELGSLRVSERRLTILQSGLGTLENVFCQHGNAVFQAASACEPGAIHAIDLQDESARAQLLFSGRSGGTLTAAAVSIPRHFSYPSLGRSGGDGDEALAYGLYYPPHNPQCRAPRDSLPPLLVNVHGGPTSSAKSAYNPAVQFWTSRGFAWLDVNHRGSSGYGRRFRQSLYGQWGVVDIEDVISAVRHLIATGKADPGRIAIRGGSAGGYVVLAALAASKVFSAGTSYYGISDLERLAQDTHKFESRYLDQLIGPYPGMAALYRERSPLYRIDRITAPVLLLQGMQDKVVPPNQAEAIYSRLHETNPRTRCLYFADEGHGFRKPHNQIAALQAELGFYEELFL